MSGNDRARFCGLCKKNVYNLSDMSRADAEALITQYEDKVCIKFYRRADGTVLTDNCPVGLRAIRNRVRWATVAASAAFVAIGAFAGMRSAKAAGVSVRDVQPFKAMQNVQPVKALIERLDPVLVKPPVVRPVMGAMALHPPVRTPQPAPQTQPVTPIPAPPSRN